MRQRRNGISTVYFVIVLLVMIGLASLAVDVGICSLTQAQLYDAIDAAGYAAAAGLQVSPAQARANAITYAGDNKINGTSLVITNSDVVLGTWNATTRVFTALSAANEPNATAVQITGVLSTARGNAVPLPLARLFGISYAQMSHTTIIGYGAGTDVMIIQDISQSFSGVLTQAKQGDQALFNALNTTGGKSCFGLVAMTGFGQTLQSMKTISGNTTAMTNAITSLAQCGSTGMPVCSGSDMAAGFIEALKDFNLSTYPNYNKTNVNKAIVFVSDGSPSSSSSGSHPSDSDAQLLTLAQTEADTAYSQGINVYGVFYNPGGDTTGVANLQSLVRGKGVLVQATTSAALVTALQGIARQLPMQLLK